MVPADSHRISRVPRYSGYRMAAESFAYRTVTCCGPTFQRVLLALRRAKTRSYYPARASLHERFGLFPGRSPLLGESLLFSSPPGTKMFQFPGFASRQRTSGCPQNADGLSHSEIRGSTAICALPRLIAAYHVLHRLREPRHPPCALSYFRTGIRQRTEPLPDKGSGRNGRSRSYFQLYCLVDSI